MHRKDFLRQGSLAAMALATGPTPLFTRAKTAPALVRLGVIGTGLRGQSHLGLLLKREDIDLAAICDVDPVMLNSAKEMITKAGKKIPKIYTGSPEAWKDL